MDEIAVLIPCFNEEITVGKVVRDFKRVLPQATVYVYDNNSTDKTVEKAKEAGVELFVLDDGWFGARNNDRAGLGDWFVNPEKFPGGLDELIGNVNALGMDFGLWVEPEMVNPDSDLYRAHPDWT